MRTIYKFQFFVADEVKIEIVGLLQILSIGNQSPGNNRLTLWAMVDTHAKANVITLRLIGTGNPVSDKVYRDGRFITTVKDDPFIWHVFLMEEK